ncbi:hypothetical protein [uncultured Jannaschia sp.]|uniref:hypothetical protein n=1 Tax=uncultured Jannaschia sp. TaxID=293347 RepID=UPI0026296A0F|nr:hypothetical protein [uncultured Jannaschia sp.]
MNALAQTRRVNHGRHIQDRHKSAARMLGFALAADCPDTWQDFATVMTKRLTLRERGTVTLMMAETLPDDELRTVLHAGQRGAGFPPVPFGDVLEEAALWASSASDEERQAYLFAAFKGLGASGRRDFLDYASREVRQ